MACIHEQHEHRHGKDCGHTAVRHEDHVDYLHDGCLHHQEGDKVSAHVLPVNAANPDTCTTGHACAEHEQRHRHGPGCGHEAVPHGDHVDYLVQGHLHYQHGDHCDDHGKLTLA
jgi:hypothetical protein